MTKLTISREDLVDIATEALKGSGVTEQQHLELCETAHRMDTVLLGNWTCGPCGCLVGTCYREKLSDDAIGQEIESLFGSRVYNLSLRFDLLVKDHLGFDKSRHSNKVKVLD